MSLPVPNSNTITPPQWQFGLRQSWIAVTILAVLFAATAPWLREFTSDHWMRLTIALACMCAGFALWIAFLIGQFRRTVAYAGPFRFVVPIIATKPIKWVYVSMWWFFALFSAATPLFFMLNGSSFPLLIFISFCAGVNSGTTILATRTQSHLWLADKGIFNGVNVAPWKWIYVSEVGTPTQMQLRIGRWSRTMLIEVNAESRAYIKASLKNARPTPIA